MASHKQIVCDWLDKCKSLDSSTPSGLASYTAEVVKNSDLVAALFTVLEDGRYHEEVSGGANRMPK